MVYVNICYYENAGKIHKMNIHKIYLTSVCALLTELNILEFLVMGNFTKFVYPVGLEV